MKMDVFIVACSVFALAYPGTSSIEAKEQPPTVEPNKKAIGVEQIDAASQLGANRHALIIGINDYADAKIPDLKYAEADAHLLYDTLTHIQIGGFKKENVTLLTGKQASSREIRKAMSSLRGVEQDDLVIVFFSGHGAKQRGETCWVTQDAELEFLADTSLTNDQLKKYLDAIPSRRLVTFIDACYAADTVINQKSIVNVGDIAKSFTGAGRVTIASAGGGQESIEAEDLKQGIFTYYLVEGLKGAADSNGDGVQTLDEVWNHLNGSVAREARKRQGVQVPTKHSHAETQTDQFLLTIDARQLSRSLQETEALKALQAKRMVVLEQLYLDEKLTRNLVIEGRRLLSADHRTMDESDQKRLACFVKMLEGELPLNNLQKMLDLIETPSQRQARLARDTAMVSDAVRREQIALLWKTAVANDNKASGQVALDALDDLLKFDPNHEKARELRAKINRHLNPPSLDLGNGVKLATVFIPPGRFNMGSPLTEDGRDAYQETQKYMTIEQGFFMGETEVTQAQWKAIVGTTPWKGLKQVKEGDHYPAVYVNWDDARAFMKALSARTGQPARLPSEVEWEYACRAGTSTAYSFGASSLDISDFAWWGGAIGDGNAKHELFAHQVKTKKPNAWDLYDMHGNVYEWCEDSYNAKAKVLRGGSWGFTPKHCRSAARYGSTPDSRANDRGFRVVLDIQQ